MSLFKDKVLALRLKNNEVSSTERFFYLLIFMLLVTFADLIPEKNTNQWDTYINIFNFFSMTICLIICHNTNKSGDDKNFIERYICLNIPVAIRAIIIGLPIAFIMTIIVKAIGYSHLKIKEIEMFILTYTIIVDLYCIFRLNSIIKIASH